MKLFCQIALLAHVAVTFILMVKTDFEGFKASSPKGFSGFMVSLVFGISLFVALLGAGAFSTLF